MGTVRGTGVVGRVVLIGCGVVGVANSTFLVVTTTVVLRGFVTFLARTITNESNNLLHYNE